MTSVNPTIAFDKLSVRSYDKDGRLHVAVTPISKANVCPYMGKEIPGWDSLGLDPNKVYNMYRDPEELEKGAASFNNLPLLKKHIQVSADAPMKDDVVGSIGSDVHFDAPYLKASLCVWDSEAIALIDAQELDELSSAYHYVPIMEPGTTPEGEAYDGRMTDIIGNHLALVETGRAGPDVAVADSMPTELAAIVGGAVKPIPSAPNKETTAMKQTKLGKALMVTLSAASPKIAQDSALLGLVGGAVKKTFDRKKTVAALCAMDAELEPEKADEIIDAVLGVEDNPEPQEPRAATETEPPKAQDEEGESKHAEIINFLKSKGLDASDLEAVGNMLTRMDRPFAKDEEPVDVEKAVNTAMDSMRAEFRDLEKAKQAVRVAVGDVIGMDSAEQVYRFALDHLKVDHKTMPAAGLATLFSVASSKSSPRKVAMDSAAPKLTIPGLDRFS